MNKALRKAVIAGNWKMNKTPAEAKELIAAIAPLVKDAGCEVIACTPFVDLSAAQEAAQGTNIQIGAENCHWEKSGAYTGEISAEMLASMGVNIVIIGHSERRQYFGETDVTVQKRVRAALDAGLTVILCVGETLEQREMGVTMELIAYQVRCALAGVAPEKARHVVIAYEPLWAIGTGKTATAEQAGEVCQAIRAVIRKQYGAHVARSVTIQYGGSMNAKNAADLLAQPDVDGGLIGGASLKPADFVEIINAANQE